MLERILNKVDALDGHLDSISQTLAKQEVQLAEHLRRTNNIEARLEPIDTHVKHVAGGFKLVAGTSIVVSIVVALAGLINLI